MSANRLWYVTRTDNDGAKTYALGGGLYGAKGAAIKLAAAAAMREFNLARMEPDGVLMRGVEVVEESND